MNKIYSPSELLSGNPYPGRGIVVGTTPDGKKAVSAYFIMGRSANSRNRVFEQKGEDLYTKPFDEKLVSDPSLIIYRAAAVYENRFIVTNGDQTDTVYEGLKKGISFAESLTARTFEPDAPNFTPRISAMQTFDNGGFEYEMSILRSADETGTKCERFHFAYPAVPGLGHFIHTYVTDGNPLPAFCGEPERMATDNDIDVFANAVWNALDENNRISLFVRFEDLASRKAEIRLFNKNMQ